MKCPNCGVELKPDEKNCHVCYGTSEDIIEEKNNDKYREYKENEQLNQKYGVNKLLVLSIFEICCCNQIFGLVSVILLFLKLKSAIVQRNFDDAEKWSRNIRLILIIGIIFGILLGIFQFIIYLVPEIIGLIYLS